MTIPISLGQHVKSNKIAPLVIDSWDALVEWLTAEHIHEGPKDTLPYWCPAEFIGHTRGNDYVKHVTVGVIDVDEATREDIAAIHQRLRVLQLDYAWHTSYSHTVETPKYRFVVRLSRVVSGGDWPRVWAGLSQIVPKLDVKCKDPTRLYYVPGHRSGTPHDSGRYDGGQALDVDAIIAHVATTVPGAALTVVGDAPTAKAWTKLGKFHADGLSANRALGGRAMLALLEGEEFAPQGQRDNALFQMAAILAEKYPHTAPSEVIALVREELLKQTAGEKWAEGDGAAELEAKLARLQGQHADDLEGGRTARLGQLGREGPYTAEEIERYCARLGVATPEELRMQLVVQHAGSLYVFYEGSYVYAGSRDHAEPLVRHRLLPAITLPGVTLTEITPKGPVDVPWAKISKDYTSHVEQVKHSLVAQAPRVNMRTTPSVFTIPSAPRDPARTPKHSALVERFLRRMAGTDDVYERLADWLATAPKLERATAALYLRGAKRTGKTTLAQGLAQIWGRRPTEIAEAVGSFNDHIKHSPVILADESIPWEIRRDSGVIRRLITANVHSLREKYQANSTLEGSIRVVIAANNLNMLYNPGEVLEQDDIQAMCDRILYVECDAREAEYVPTTELADHILHLEATRTVIPDGRSWVIGADSALHRALRTRGRHRAAVCQWLLKFIEAPKLVGGHATRWRLGPEGCFVAPRLLHSQWNVFMENERVLDLPALTNALYEISERGIVPGLVKVRLEDLWQFAEHHSWGIPDFACLENAVRLGSGM